MLHVCLVYVECVSGVLWGDLLCVCSVVAVCLCMFGRTYSICYKTCFVYVLCRVSPMKHRLFPMKYVLCMFCNSCLVAHTVSPMKHVLCMFG